MLTQPNNRGKGILCVLRLPQKFHNNSSFETEGAGTV